MNDSIDVEIDIEKTGMRSRSTGNNGYSCRNSRRTKKNPITASKTAPVMIIRTGNSCEAPSIRPMIRKNVIALRMPPGMSKRRPRMRTGFTGRNL